MFGQKNVLHQQAMQQSNMREKPWLQNELS